MNIEVREGDDNKDGEAGSLRGMAWRCDARARHAIKIADGAKHSAVVARWEAVHESWRAGRASEWRLSKAPHQIWKSTSEMRLPLILMRGFVELSASSRVRRVRGEGAAETDAGAAP